MRARARRDLRFYWYALAAFLGGIGLNAVYGVIQLVLAEGGINLDEILIEPITSRQTGINVFGAVGGTQEVFRPNALTGDPTAFEAALRDYADEYGHREVTSALLVSQPTWGEDPSLVREAAYGLAAHSTPAPLERSADAELASVLARRRVRLLRVGPRIAVAAAAARAARIVRVAQQAVPARAAAVGA